MGINTAHFADLVPERIALCAASLLYAEHTARAAGESAQCELQVFALPRLPVGTRHAVTKISPKLYTPRVLPTIRVCLEGLALMI